MLALTEKSVINSAGQFGRDTESRTPLIEIRGISKSFHSFTAINDLSLNIYEKEFFALLGPSGCGKSTLLRMLAGFETPTSGQILLNGENMVSIPPEKRPINMMFQSYALFPHLTLEQNIAFGLKRLNMAKDEIHSRVAEMLSLVQMEKFARRKPGQISGGQRQRIALARSLARRPKMLLLDEPMAALDKKLRRETQLELMDIQHQLGTTFVIVTHDQEEAMTVANRIGIMDHGHLVQVSTPLETYENPVSRHVAEFVGDTNVFCGHVNAVKESGWQFCLDKVDTVLVAPELTGVPSGNIKYLNVRPEKMAVSRDYEEDSSNYLKGTIIDVAYLGNLSTYYVDVGLDKPVLAQMTNSQRLHTEHFAEGDVVWVSWYPQDGQLLVR
ncbi:ABC transporter ATP-binding protein [Rhodanobacter aciditrophus]|uniref:Spermidine/putrescine import ATP-binding protein PotA n=1 Tax=Rhodanobacter aciditrophus TaxID=1623218 RepID=A0ABW4AX88_9GAMM